MNPSRALPLALCLALAACKPAHSASPANAPRVEGEVLATVNGVPVTRDEVQGAAHGSLSHGGGAPERNNDALARLTALIAATPTPAALYLERGELYAKHADWLAAEANYLRAAELAPRLPGLDLARGALALATAQPAVARTFLDRALNLTPDEPEALILRARALAQLAHSAAALADYDAALRVLSSPAPELFLERAAVCATSADALRVLDEGLARLGPVPGLALRALDLEVSLGRTAAALARLLHSRRRAQRLLHRLHIDLGEERRRNGARR
jgi:tetratricopeptide (TPR) repeat protein